MHLLHITVMPSVVRKAGNLSTACTRTSCSSRHARLECFSALEMMTALTLVSVIHFSGSHSGAVRTSSEVPGRSEEAQPARRRTCAAHGHLPALPRFVCSPQFINVFAAFSNACKDFSLEQKLFFFFFFRKSTNLHLSPRKRRIADEITKSKLCSRGIDVI